MRWLGVGILALAIMAATLSMSTASAQQACVHGPLYSADGQRLGPTGTLCVTVAIDAGPGTPTRSAVPTPIASTPTRSVIATPAATPRPTAAPGGSTRIVGAGGQYSTISAALSASNPGDTIRVKAGRYNEQATVSRDRITLMAFGDGPVWIDGQCQRPHAVVINAHDAVVRGLSASMTTDSAILINGDTVISARATIDGTTIQDYNCADAGEQGAAGIAAYYSGPGQRITGNTISRRVDVDGPAPGQGDAIWFKSNSSHPSGGGHYIANNVITGGWDGIGGEEENDRRGGFDRDTLIEKNVIRNCADDGVQVEGGGQNVVIQDNEIVDCGTAFAAAAPLTGPVTIQRNVYRGSEPGYYGEILCLKVGNQTTALVRFLGNDCVVDWPSSVPLGTNLGKGIEQTNGGLGPLEVSGNRFSVSGYVFEFSETPPAGSAFSGDCLETSDPDRFIKWGGQLYGSLQAFQNATRQDLNGKSGPC